MRNCHQYAPLGTRQLTNAHLSRTPCGARGEEVDEVDAGDEENAAAHDHEHHQPTGKPRVKPGIHIQAVHAHQVQRHGPAFGDLREHTLRHRRHCLQQVQGGSVGRKFHIGVDANAKLSAGFTDGNDLLLMQISPGCQGGDEYSCGQMRSARRQVLNHGRHGQLMHGRAPIHVHDERPAQWRVAAEVLARDASGKDDRIRAGER